MSRILYTTCIHVCIDEQGLGSVNYMCILNTCNYNYM